MDNGILATLIAAALAGIGVTLAKDTKVSEFRQQWIDALRDDVSEYLALVVRAFEVKRNVGQQQLDIDKLAELMTRLNTVMYRIHLRLDLKEKSGVNPHWTLGEALFNSRACVINMAATREQMNDSTGQIQRAAAVVLDVAWEKVKTGEPQYQHLRRLCYVALVLCFIVFVGNSIYRSWKPSTAITHVSIDNPVSLDVRGINQPSGDGQRSQQSQDPSTQAHPGHNHSSALP